MEPPTPSPTPSSQTRRVSPWPDRIFFVIIIVVAVVVLLLAVAIVAILAYNARQSFQVFGWGFLWSTTWNPDGQVFGALPFIVGTLLTSAIALLIAIPLSLGSAIFIATQAPRWLRVPLGTAVELLAAIPSVIYGFWGIYVVHPFMHTIVEPWLQANLGWTGLFSGPLEAGDVLTASIVLAIMVVPTVSAISRDTLMAVPAAQTEAALSLGATDWETTRVAMIPYARSGIVGGVILGLGRAIGETMAVTMLIGNKDAIPTSLLSGGQTISSLIANELFSNQGPLQISAILECGLVLLIISLAVNVVARLLVWRVTRTAGGGVV